jgi:hypothetical protein
VFQRSTGVEPGEKQEVVDEPSHAHGFGLDPAQGMTHVVGDGLGAPQGQLRVAADAGQRGAQLMARVRHEATQPGLAGLALFERGLDVPQHLVESRPELPHFGAWVSFGHPVGQVDGAAAKGHGRDLVGRRGDPVQGA